MPAFRADAADSAGGRHKLGRVFIIAKWRGERKSKFAFAGRASSENVKNCSRRALACAQRGAV